MKARGGAEKRREKRIEQIGAVVDEVWSASEARARVKVIVNMLAVMQENGFHLSDGTDGAARDVAKALGVPFFIVWLANENSVANHDVADLDDIEEGLRWLNEHKVSRDLLRCTAARRQEWEEAVAKLEAEKHAGKAGG